MPTEADGRLQRLEDAEAIRQLIARYGPLADAGDAASVAALWIEDGQYDVGGFGVARGRAEIAALIDAPFHRSLIAEGSAHALSAPAITLSGDTATAINHSVVWRRSGDGFVAWRVSANRWELVRSHGSWRVKRRVNRPLDGTEATQALLALP